LELGLTMASVYHLPIRAYKSTPRNRTVASRLCTLPKGITLGHFTGDQPITFSNADVLLYGTPTRSRTERTSPFERDDFANLSMGALSGGDREIRTPDRFRMKELLYQLSYITN